MFKEADNDVSLVLSNNESLVSEKSAIFWVVLHIQFHLERPGGGGKHMEMETLVKRNTCSSM